MIDLKPITYKTAKLASEVGYDETFDYDASYYATKTIEILTSPNSWMTSTYVEGDLIHGYYGDDLVGDNDLKDVVITSKSQHHLQKWLREKHDIHININYHSGYYHYVVHRFDHHDYIEEPPPISNTYEECLEKALQVGLDILHRIN